MFYELASSSWGKAEIDAMHRVIDSGFFTMGEYVAQFEREFAAYFGKAHGVMVNSGSSANLVGTAARAYKKDNPLQRGDEVADVGVVGAVPLLLPSRPLGRRLPVALRRPHLVDPPPQLDHALVHQPPAPAAELRVVAAGRGATH